MDEVLSFFEDVSRRVTGREIAQVLLLHASTLNADHFARVADLLARRGYRIVSLDEALTDPVYQRPETTRRPLLPAWAKTFLMKCTRQRCQVALSTLVTAAFWPSWASEMTSFTPRRPRASLNFHHVRGL